MSESALKLCIPSPGGHWNESQLASVNPCLEKMSADERIDWALQFLPQTAVLSSSFGAQSAVMLHLLNEHTPGIPVILVDTGYLFPETYRFIDELTERLDLNLRVYRSRLSPGWQEARHGRMWESGTEGIRRYNQINKVEPMQEALQDLQAGTWFSGIRRSQSDTRAGIGILQSRDSVVKVHPIADWTDRDVHRYLKNHGLPYHPLWDEGYVSIGDRHTSEPLSAGMTEQDTRFFGLLRECGLHDTGQEDIKV